MKFKVGDRVLVKRLYREGKIVYINPDGKLAEVKLEKEWGFSAMYHEEDLLRLAK